MPNTSVLTSEILKWSKILTELGRGFPDSALAKMDAADLLASAQSWAHALHDVPLEAIEPLYDRVIVVHKGAFVPTVSEFRAVWNDWDYYAELNGRADEPEEFLALPEPEGARSQGPGYFAASLQKQRDAAHLPMVSCECMNRYGRPLLAMVNSEKTHWVCGHMGNPDATQRVRRCGFWWPVDDTLNAPLRIPNEAFSDEAVLLLLKNRCRMDVEKIGGEAAALSFGRWLLERVAAGELTKERARELWQEWKKGAEE